MPIQIYIGHFTTKNGKFTDKNSDISFIFLLKNRDCGYPLKPPDRGGSKEYPQYIFLSRKKINSVYLISSTEFHDLYITYKPQFCYIKVVLKWGQNRIGMFS